MSQQKKTVVPLVEIERYFDGSTRDRIDLTGHSRRVSDLLHLREQLLRLPDDTYEATIAAMRGLLQQAATGTLPASSQPASPRASSGEAARQLYEAARQKAADGASANASGGSSAASQISKV